MIVQELHRIQNIHGFLPDDELRSLSDRTGTPLYRLEEVSSFFPHFLREPPPQVEVTVCRDMTCHLRGSDQIIEKLQALPECDGKRMSANGVSCLGRCDRAPVTRIGHHNYMIPSATDVIELVQQVLAGGHPPADTDEAYNDLSTTWDIDIYDLKPEFHAVRRYIEAEDRDAERDRIIGALETANLLGMGGAGGRAYKKWRDVYNAVGTEKYVVVNGDESEPGTFKDRELLLRTPYLTLEAVILAGLVLSGTRGYIYIRHEFEEQIDACNRAIKQAEEMGYCGEDILGSGIDFPVEVFASPGGYICGEQTALIEAMEDKRAEPRNRPPELQTNGLWDKPTLLNNVETMAWVPSIVLKDNGQWFADKAKPGYKGKRFFSISGDLEKPGPYEVPIGITLGEMINDYCGGMKDGQELKAFAASGPSGGFLPRMLPVEYLGKRFADTLPEGTTHFDILDWQLDIGLSRQMGLMMGAGMVVYGENADMVEQALACLKFYRAESCGKCVPCRIGSQKLVDLGSRIHAKEFDSGAVDLTKDLVEELAEVMEITAICGLGTVAPNPLRTLLRHFPEEVEKYKKK
ncbi:MAG: NADH-quinone oxidoreductase subunit L [Planctomycetaceae bacterium]|nr:NADH-quinone oxidoreductase subunit L [Planctomycetaceae bacterium]